MLLDKNPDLFDILHEFNASENIEKIRLINKSGMIVFSTDSTELDTRVQLEDEACYLCHQSSNVAIQEPNTSDRRRIFTDQEGNRHIGYITGIKNDPSCYTAPCHVHSSDETVLGVFDVVISLKRSDELIAGAGWEMISENIAVTLFMALAVGLFIWVGVHVPLNKFLLGTKEISSGNLNHKIDVESHDEIGVFAKSFNKMTDDLRHAKSEITEWSEELEKRVKEKTEELQSTQNRILQIEKMASLGKLSATVAHELNNPMAGILTSSKLIQKKIEKMNDHSDKYESIQKTLKMIENESERCGNIIKDLLLFSRKQRTELKTHQINDVINSSFQLVMHHLTLHNITLKKELQSDLPSIMADENQIKQMLLALYVNAVEAMETGGVLTVSTIYQQGQDRIILKVKDDGKGIPEEIQANLFEPFFTTKNSVKGSGLGLSVVYGIVQTHHGDISINSMPGKGAEFIIKLPLKIKQTETE
jgi:two-component system NtrC family sensor kinase